MRFGVYIRFCVFMSVLDAFSCGTNETNTKNNETNATNHATTAKTNAGERAETKTMQPIQKPVPGGWAERRIMQPMRKPMPGRRAEPMPGGRNQCKNQCRAGAQNQCRSETKPLYIVQCTLYIVHRTLHIAQCTLYIVHSIGIPIRGPLKGSIGQKSNTISITKKTFVGVYGIWEALDGRKIIPLGVGTFCTLQKFV